jgi:N4-bis(aminopropyl)spermidine synthase
MTDKSKIKSDLVSLLQKYSKDRPKPERSYDQFYATIETTAARACVMEENGDIAGRIAFLGDDDLTSVAVSYLNKQADLTVFEIDERQTKNIRRIAQKEGLRIQLLEADLREQSTKTYNNRYDVVFTDPPYTPAGISIFLNRAIEMLKNSTKSRIYLCYGTSDRSRERELAIQDVIIKKGLVINTKLPEFNKYIGAASINNQSSLYILDFTPKTHTTPVAGSRIYTNE